MRLQVSIQRHGLPTTNIFFTPRCLGPLPATSTTDATIAQLLEDINDVVPLESTDWGLEDYAVEINGYECLHFHPIHSVLRDNDQITIRPLQTEDLRLRRLGGRHQISHDGRHLIDGVAFGKPWLRKGGRPAIEIPPRKKRKIGIEGDIVDVTNKNQLSPNDRQSAISSLTETPQAEDTAIDHTDREIADNDAQPLQIEAPPSSQNILNQDGITPDQGNEMLAELLDLLDEDRSLAATFADFLEKPVQDERSQDHMGTTRARKRKRAADGEDGLQDDETDFNGFSTPVRQDSDDSDKDWKTDSAYESTLSSGYDSDRSGSVDKSSVSQAMVLREKSDSDEEIFSDESEASSSESSELESESSINDKESSSPSSSFNEEASNVADEAPSTEMKSNLFDDSSRRKSTESSIRQPNPARVSPGRGSKRTHYGNKRIRKRRKLARLKESGLLPENANFADMDALKDSLLPELNGQDDRLEKAHVANLEVLAHSLHSANDGNDSCEDAEFDDGLEVNKAKLLAQISGRIIDQDIGPEDQKQHDTDPNDYEKASEPVGPTGGTPTNPITNSRAHSSPTTKDAKSEPRKKRTKLDLASSRNLIFGSLGVRTPKTPEAEQALREKFTRSNQGPGKPLVPPTLLSYDRHPQVTVSSPNEPWQSKLIISAVECESEEVKLTAPPFPFKQFWHQDAMRSPLENSSSSYNTYQDGNGDCVAGHGIEEVQPIHDEDHGTQQSDEPPRPENFEILPTLGQREAKPGALIAFKELIISEDTFQPEISAYRIGRVQAIRDDSSLDLLISAHDRKRRRTGQYDEETGERIWRKFEVPTEGAIEDNSHRTISFQDLINPKIVQSSKLSHQSNQNDGSAATHITQTDTVAETSIAIDDTTRSASHEAQRDLAVVSLLKLDVSTPRRTEISAIIKEAGFDSTLDPEVLPPVNGLDESKPLSVSAQATPLTKARDDPPEPAERSQSSDPNTSGFDSPRFNGDSSSPAPISRETKDLSDLGEVARTADGDPTGVQSELEQADVVYPSLSQLYGTGFLSSEQRLPDEHERYSSQAAFEPFALASDWRSDPDDEAYDFEESEGKIYRGKPNDSGEPAYEVGQENELNGVGDSENEIDHEDDTNDIHMSADEPDAETLRSVVQPSSNEHAALPSSPQPDESLFLGGRDGHDSLDEAELPSILEISSTARLAKVSPPPVRRPWKGKVSPRSKSAVASLASMDQSSQRNIKPSQSQVRWSQIPEGSQVVDLTISSEPMSPGSTDDDHLTPKLRSRKSHRTWKNKPTKEEVLAVNSGLGNRRLLKSRKDKASS